MHKMRDASEIPLDRLSGISTISEVLQVCFCGVTEGRRRKPIFASSLTGPETCARNHVTLLMTVERQKEISNNYGRQTRADFGSSAAKLSGSTRPCDPDLP
jgi:hypothetical protein